MWSAARSAAVKCRFASGANARVCLALPRDPLGVKKCSAQRSCLIRVLESGLVRVLNGFRDGRHWRECELSTHVDSMLWPLVQARANASRLSSSTQLMAPAQVHKGSTCSDNISRSLPGNTLLLGWSRLISAVAFPASCQGTKQIEG